VSIAVEFTLIGGQSSLQLCWVDRLVKSGYHSWSFFYSLQDTSTLKSNYFLRLELPIGPGEVQPRTSNLAGDRKVS
jgi:hypothetical protein